MKNLRLSNLNVLIGANGSGKSNFVAYFHMLSELVEGRLQVWVSKQGGADRVLKLGSGHIESKLKHEKEQSTDKNINDSPHTAPFTGPLDLILGKNITLAMKRGKICYWH